MNPSLQVIYRWRKQAIWISSRAAYHTTRQHVATAALAVSRWPITRSERFQGGAAEGGGGVDKSQKQVGSVRPVQVNVEVPTKQTNLFSCWKQTRKVSLFNLEGKTAALQSRHWCTSACLFFSFTLTCEMNQPDWWSSVYYSQRHKWESARHSSPQYLFDLGVSYKEPPQCVAGVHFGALQGHHDVAVLLAVLRRPVLVTFPLVEGGG